jgi:hypothetical protein
VFDIGIDQMPFFHPILEMSRDPPNRIIVPSQFTNLLCRLAWFQTLSQIWSRLPRPDWIWVIAKLTLPIYAYDLS